MFEVGDKVCVHGQGFGNVKEIFELHGHPHAVVAIPRVDYHEPSRRRIEWTERLTVQLDVYPPHLSRSTA